MKANSGNFCFGFSETLVLLPEKYASVTFMLSTSMISKIFDKYNKKD
jgi:hypothetical protein